MVYPTLLVAVGDLIASIKADAFGRPQLPAQQLRMSLDVGVNCIRRNLVGDLIGVVVGRVYPQLGPAVAWEALGEIEDLDVLGAGEVPDHIVNGLEGVVTIEVVEDGKDDEHEGNLLRIEGLLHVQERGSAAHPLVALGAEVIDALFDKALAAEGLGVVLPGPAPQVGPLRERVVIVEHQGVRSEGLDGLVLLPDLVLDIVDHKEKDHKVRVQLEPVVLEQGQLPPGVHGWQGGVDGLDVLVGALVFQRCLKLSEQQVLASDALSPQIAVAEPQDPERALGLLLRKLPLSQPDRAVLVVHLVARPKVPSGVRGIDAVDCGVWDVAKVHPLHGAAGARADGVHSQDRGWSADTQESKADLESCEQPDSTEQRLPTQQVAPEPTI
jgi:hypothetical protein